MVRRVISWGMALMLIFGLSVLTASAEDAESVQADKLSSSTHSSRSSQIMIQSATERPAKMSS